MLKVPQFFSAEEPLHCIDSNLEFVLLLITFTNNVLLDCYALLGEKSEIIQRQTFFQLPNVNKTA